MEISDESMTAREELEMMSSNGILDGSFEYGEALRRLGEEAPGAAAVVEKSAEGNATGEEGVPTMASEEFSGNGLLFGLTEHSVQQTTTPDQAKESLASAASANAGEFMPEFSTVGDEFQGNGILRGDLAMADEPAPTGGVEGVPSPVVVPALQTGLELNGLLEDAMLDTDEHRNQPTEAIAVPLRTNGADEARDPGSSLDRLLDGLDSRGYTAAQKGKGRAIGHPNPVAIKRVPAIDTARSATPILQEVETPTSGESLFPGMNLVLMNDEAERLQPLEAVDGKGRKVVFKRRPRKVVDGKGVNSSLRLWPDTGMSDGCENSLGRNL